MKVYCPIHLDLEGKKCVVVGGGKVAERRIKSLLECRALVHLVSPRVTSNLRKLIARGEITYFERGYQVEDLEGAFLVIAATDRPEVNLKVAKDARALNLLINTPGSPKVGNFIFPALLRRGYITISVSTSGRSPALAKRIKEELENLYSLEWLQPGELPAKGRDRAK